MSDSLIAFHPAIVEHQAFFDSRVVDRVDVLSHVLQFAARVGKAQIDILRVVLFYQVEEGI
jgi:hypothetical protein